LLDATVIRVHRNLAWVEDNRRNVDQMTGGRVAGLPISPDTSSPRWTRKP
jgi:hypothetical protein